jgi:hypothetical protein
MALWSRSLRDYDNNNGSFKRGMNKGKFNIYQGTMPTDSDAAIVGTLLTSCSASSGAFTPDIAARGSVTLTSATDAQTITGLTVNSVQLMSGTVTAASDTVTTFAAKVIANIQAAMLTDYKVWNEAGKIFIENPPGLGTCTYTVALGVSGTTHSDVNMGTERAGQAAVNGCLLGESADGVQDTSGIWSGVNVATGTANFFVWYGNPGVDTGAADAAPWQCRRIIGSCGTAGSDYVMASTALVVGKTHTVDTSSITTTES